MRLIVGLGNPSEKYENTRHNIGFLILDNIAEKKGVMFRLENQFLSENADFNINGERVKLAKPNTFMNSSGKAIQKLKNYYKLDSEDIWTIHDDVDLEEGIIRIVLGGSSAGHKGVQSIIDNIGSEDFWRVRVGVGRSDVIPTDDWVLMNFEDKEKIAKIIDEVAEMILEFLEKGIINQTFEIN